MALIISLPNGLRNFKDAREIRPLNSQIRVVFINSVLLHKAPSADLADKTGAWEVVVVPYS